MASAGIPRYDDDVFVSYAHVDDVPYPGAEIGWVTTLIRSLKIRLAQLLGRQDAFSLWMDHQLRGNVEVTPELNEKLQGTATLVIVLSPGYLKSEWCEREREMFFQKVKERRADGAPVFVIERDRVDRGQWPEELSDLRGYRFWVEDPDNGRPRILGIPQPTPMDKLYYDALNDLARDLTQQMQSRTQPTPEAPEVVAQVLLAEVTDDLDPARTMLARKLEQMGLRVVPEAWYPRRPDELRKAFAEDLASSKIFVQLLSAVAGKRMPGSDESFPALQHRLARENESLVLQWRDPAFNETRIQDEVVDLAHRDLLTGSTVQAVNIEEFKRDIYKRATYSPPLPSQMNRDLPGSTYIFVNMDAQDRPVANDICEYLKRSGLGYAIPLCEGEPAKVRADFEANVLDCDAMIVVYGEAENAWVRAQLREVRKLLYRRDREMYGLAIYEGSPALGELGFTLPNMQIIDCKQGLDELRLRQFLGLLKEEIERTEMRGTA